MSAPEDKAPLTGAGAETRILKVDPEADAEAEELDFDLAFQRSLTTAQRFELMFRRSCEMAELLRAHGYGSASPILKRT